MLALFLFALGASAQMVCPSAPVFQHAGCEITISFQNSCSDVLTVMTNRIKGQYALWHDPHNNGTYTILSQNSTVLNTKRLTGNGQYTDLQTFTLAASSTSACTMYACSESQVYSVGDYGTNFCNLHDLYCNNAQCCPIPGDPVLQYTEKVGKCTQATPSACYAIPC